MTRGQAHYWMLDADGNPLQIDDVAVWGAWFERTKDTRERVLAKDQDEGATGEPIEVSTVFLGLDHNFGQGPPILWETLVFGGPLDGEMDRYATRAAALFGHRAMCARVRAAIEDAKAI